MITVSLCMIVKNEEKILARCLDSLADLMDEIIIVDTGSTDRTKEIARRYTDRLYDFAWIDDFSAARNFAFAKATKDYIYSADADEVLSDPNRQRFEQLKETLLPEIEIVQMKYGNQLQYGTVYNYDEEYRPKLFKRQRQFVWIEPIHETVRLDPVVYDSDIVITHLPENSHAGRDLEVFAKQLSKGHVLSKRLVTMYARELLLAADASQLQEAALYFASFLQETQRSEEEIRQCFLVLAKAARMREDVVCFFKYVSKLLAEEACSEICCELGQFYEDAQDEEEAAIWYYNAAFETEPLLCLQSKETKPLEGLVRCYEALHLPKQAQEYRQLLREKEKR